MYTFQNDQKNVKAPYCTYKLSLELKGIMKCNSNILPVKSLHLLSPEQPQQEHIILVITNITSCGISPTTIHVQNYHMQAGQPITGRRDQQLRNDLPIISALNQKTTYWKFPVVPHKCSNAPKKAWTTCGFVKKWSKIIKRQTIWKRTLNKAQCSSKMN